MVRFTKFFFLGLSLFGTLVAFQNCGQGFQSTLSTSLSSTNNNGQDGNELPLPPPLPPTPKLELVVANALAKQSLDLNFSLQVKAQTQPIVVNYETMDGTAIRIGDYAETKGTLTIPAGSTGAPQG